MDKLDREIIHIISRHGDLKEEDLEGLLAQYVKPDQQDWQAFVKILLLILGIGFFVSGVLFFFAYNWDSLNKFLKIGIIESLVIGTMVPILFTKLSLVVKNSLLSAASILVGVLFAVFGQVYQTGANAYDFFLGWTMFVALWTFVANFPILWMTFAFLVNITLGLYILQVARDMPAETVMLYFFLINSSAIILFHFLHSKNNWFVFPNWLEVFIALFAFIASTIGISFGIHNEKTSEFLPLLLSVLVGYSLAVWHSYKHKKVFYLAIISLSFIICVTSLLFKISNTEGMFLGVCFFIVASVTASIFYIIQTHKRWHHVE